MPNIAFRNIKFSKGYSLKLLAYLIGITFLFNYTESLYAESAFLNEDLLKGKQLKNTNGILKKLPKGRYELTVPSKVQECKIEIPVTITDWEIYNTLEIGINSSNNNTTVIVEAYEPSHTHFLKKTFKLSLKKSVYSFKIDPCIAATKINLLRLTFFNKQDNSHIPESTIEHPIKINFIHLLSSRYAFRKVISVGEKLLKQCDYSSLGIEANQAANKKRLQLQNSFQTLLNKLKLKEQTIAKKRKLLKQLYRLKNEAKWAIELEALKAACAQKHIIYASCGGADKIFRQKSFPGNFNGKAEIRLAKNETEACQIALFSEKAINSITVDCTGLINNEGDRIKPEQIEICPIGYVNTTKPRYYVDFYGWTPDPLLTYMKEFNLAANNYQPVWIDVKTAFNQPSGTYRGKVNFYTNRKKLVSVPLAVKVWNFRLPEKMSFPTAISCGINGGNRFPYFYCKKTEILKEYFDFLYSDNKHLNNLSLEAQRLVKIYNQTTKELNKHHISENYIYRNMNKNPVPAKLREKFKKHQTEFCIGYSGGNSVPKTLEMIAPQINATKKDGSYNLAYIYGYDEIRRKGQFDTMKRVWGAVKKAYPEIPLMATALDYSYGEKTGTKDIVDIWVVPTPNYIGSIPAVKRARARGKKVWWYTCNWPFPPYANFLLETSATSHRLLLGFMPWKFEVDGYLYYATLGWRKGTLDNNQLKSWKLFGNTQIQKFAANIYDSEIKVTTSPKISRSGIWQWQKFRQNFPKKITISAESLVGELSNGKAEDYALSFKVIYCDGTEKKLIQPFNEKAKGWQKLEFSFVPQKSVKNFAIKMQVNNRIGTVFFRNPSVSQEGCKFVRNQAWDKPITGGPLTNYDGRGYTMHNGDGFLIYPATDRTIPSIRLKCLRDGLEDYEYLVMLRKSYNAVKAGNIKIAKREEWLAKAEKNLQIDKTLVKSISSYTQDGAALLKYRSQIGELLSCLPQ